MKARKLLLAGVLAAAFGVTGPALAQTDDYVTPPEEGTVLGTELDRTPAAPTPAAPASTSRAGGSLPVTGGDVAGLTAIGLAAIGGGAVLVRRSRRTAESATA